MKHIKPILSLALAASLVAPLSPSLPIATFAADSDTNISSDATTSAISINKSDITVYEGQVDSIIVTDPTATDSSDCTFKSSDTSVVTVAKAATANGKIYLDVTPVNYGTASITVTAADGKSKATCAVSVYCSTFSIDDLVLNKGDKQTVKPIFANGYTFKKDISYSSSDDSVATVANGTITAIKDGTTTITAKILTENNKGATDVVSTTFQVTVATLVTSISVKESSLTMFTDETYQLEPTIAPEDATTKDVTYTSKNEDVVTVSKSGLITPVAAGETKIEITATDGSKVKKVVTVSVKDGSVTRIGSSDSALNGGTLLSLSVNESKTVTLTIESEHVKDVTKAISVKSADESVASASMSKDGVIVKGIKEGATKITVSSGEVSFDFTVNVTKAQTQAQAQATTNTTEITPTPTTINTGDTKSTKKNQSITTASKKNVTYKVKKLKKKASSFRIGVTAKTKVSYKVTKGSKYIKVSKSGKVSIKKGTKKGTYKIVVSAAESDEYNSATTTVTIKVK